MSWWPSICRKMRCRRYSRSDGELALDEMTLDMAHLLADAGPWGQQFPEPLFHDQFELVSQRVVGERHLKMVLKKGDRLFDAIAFRPAGPG